MQEWSLIFVSLLLPPFSPLLFHSDDPKSLSLLHSESSWVVNGSSVAPQIFSLSLFTNALPLFFHSALTTTLFQFLLRAFLNNAFLWRFAVRNNRLSSHVLRDSFPFLLGSTMQQLIFLAVNKKVCAFVETERSIHNRHALWYG